MAEHHSIPGVASAATAVLLAHIAAGTSTIRVGAGGVMLPNHAPLLIAEQFGTLAALHPGRIDLGVGRAPGSDQATARALRRSPAAADTFPQDVMELLAWFEPAAPGQTVHAVPGEGLDVPVWILGSSLFGAQLAAALGLPFAFASHFAPAHIEQALALYRTQFRASERCEQPYVMIAANVFAADTDDEARLLFSSLQQAFIGLRRGQPRPLQPPVANLEMQLHPAEQLMLDDMLRFTAVGAPQTVAARLANIVRETGADELMITSQIYDHQARLRSFGITARVRDAM
jgi:luciferase family oxidoreductase group 1